MKNKLLQIKQQALAALAKAGDASAGRDLQIKYLGRRGSLTMLLRDLPRLPAAERKATGQLANEIKVELREKIAAKINNLKNQPGLEELIDVTLPGSKFSSGHLHPVTIVQNELEDLFSSLGFLVLDGPELESDYYNFTALNFPQHHPARDIQDVFYIDKKNDQGEYDLLMRAHTSPMQVRAMQKYGAPLRCVVPGRVFRYEATDATHETTFYQLEGLMVDQNISLANLIAVMKTMLKGIFRQEIVIRVRPGYFPFVEPGLEVDMRCTICRGRGCPSCKHNGWLEMIGSGMVHPRVLAYGGIDPKKYSGFAFGLGLTRLAMMKYQIDDIRLFNSGDLRFLEQF